MITEYNDFFKTHYLDFHKKDSDALYRIDDILINKFIDEDGCYNTISFNKHSIFTYLNDNLVDVVTYKDMLDEDDNSVMVSNHQYHVYQNNKVFTSIYSTMLFDDDGNNYQSDEFSVNYLYKNNLLAEKHYSIGDIEYIKYNKKNLISKISSDDSTIKFSYHKNNKVSEKIENNIKTIYDYDSNDNINHIQVSKKGKIIHEIYNVYHNNLLTETHYDGYDCLFSYNNNGLITSIKESFNNALDNHHHNINIEYDNNNHIKYVNYNNGLEEFYTFNNDNILLKFSNNHVGIIFENDDIILNVDKSKTIIHSNSHSIH
jgi:hypothetical protein